MTKSFILLAKNAKQNQITTAPFKFEIWYIVSTHILQLYSVASNIILLSRSVIVYKHKIYYVKYENKIMYLYKHGRYIYDSYTHCNITHISNSVFWSVEL